MLREQHGREFAEPHTDELLSKITNIGLWRAALCILAFQYCVKSALASGEIYVRQPSSSNIANCSDGFLTERLHEGGDIHGSYSSLVIACVSRDSQFASWVLISGTNCHSMNVEVCRTQAARRIPRIFVDPNFWRIEGKTAPFKMQYQLIRWGLGKRLREDQATSYVEAVRERVKQQSLCMALQRTKRE